MRDVKPVDKALWERRDDANLKDTAVYPVHVGEGGDGFGDFIRRLEFREKAGRFFAAEGAVGVVIPSRDGRKLYVANRGSHKIHGPRKGPGSVAVLDFATDKIVATWAVPGVGSPDMGNVTADGKYLWLSGRYDDVVYRFDTANGAVQQIAVGQEPHGLTVWPQPGRYSLGHTGNLR